MLGWRGLAGALELAAVIASSALAQEPDPDRAARLMDDLMWGRGHVGGPFTLIDHTGKQRTDADFRGKLLIVYFGYTTCPDICPTELMQIGLAVDKLGAAGDEVQPLFISVDPERDTPAVLAPYVAQFHPRLIGLTGTPQQIRSVADSYKAYYAKYTPPDGAIYLIDHTGFVYLVGRDGQYAGFFPPGTTADRMIEIILPLLAKH
ncbi:MAG TPA: SCO family protein [Xanthobacteraceae bacterium]|nr:SCO family protein [Xanthobacteraceae bacterium]